MYCVPQVCLILVLFVPLTYLSINTSFDVLISHTCIYMVDYFVSKNPTEGCVFVPLVERRG